jgi:hypothetical protein
MSSEASQKGQGAKTMQTVFKEKLDSDHPSWQDDLIHRGFDCDGHKRAIACQA